MMLVDLRKLLLPLFTVLCLLVLLVLGVRARAGSSVGGTPLSDLKLGDEVVRPTAVETALDTLSNEISVTQSNLLADAITLAQVTNVVDSALLTATNAPGQIRAVEYDTDKYRLFIIEE